MKKGWFCSEGKAPNNEMQRVLILSTAGVASPCSDLMFHGSWVEPILLCTVGLGQK